MALYVLLFSLNVFKVHPRYSMNQYCISYDWELFKLFRYIHSSVDTHLGCYFSVILENSAMNTFLCVFLFLLSTYFGMG